MGGGERGGARVKEIGREVERGGNWILMPFQPHSRITSGRVRERERERGRETELVSWYFEPSQPQTIVLGLKTVFNLSPSFSAHKSSNHKFS